MNLRPRYLDYKQMTKKQLIECIKELEAEVNKLIMLRIKDDHKTPQKAETPSEQGL